MMSLTGCANIEKPVILQEWEIIYTEGDYYLISQALWEKAMNRLTQYQTLLEIEKIEFPEKNYADKAGYLKVKKSDWKRFLQQLNLFRTKYKIKKIEMEKEL